MSPKSASPIPHAASERTSYSFVENRPMHRKFLLQCISWFSTKPREVFCTNLTMQLQLPIMVWDKKEDEEEEKKNTVISSEQPNYEDTIWN